MPTLQEKFTVEEAMNLISIDDSGCWLWQGYCCKGKMNYGMVPTRGWGSTLGVNAKAHRFFYMHLVGPIPDGVYVLHKCDIPNCCNPEHLFLGSRLDNITDMVSKDRQWKPKREKNYWFGKSRSEESRTKQAENHTDVTGANNPMFGKKNPRLTRENKIRPVKDILALWCAL